VRRLVKFRVCEALGTARSLLNSCRCLDGSLATPHLSERRLWLPAVLALRSTLASAGPAARAAARSLRRQEEASPSYGSLKREHLIFSHRVEVDPETDQDGGVPDSWDAALAG
jgi:hypothetical protein